MPAKNTKQKILIATTNPGKFNEFASELNDLPFTFIGLKDAGLADEEPAETHETTRGNALAKAEWYARKSGLITIADDTGFFIARLNGQPGIRAKRYAKNTKDACEKILQKLRGVEHKKRGAYFETSCCLYDPNKNSVHLFQGRVDGYIGEKTAGRAAPGMIYDQVFYYPPAKKYFSEMTISEKTLISHRGRAVSQLKIFLNKHYELKQIIAPVALICKNGKILLLKRRDSRPEFNNKWEFPGGGVERGESIEQCLRRECREETGFTVTIEERLPKIVTKEETKWNYQVHLIIFVCTVQSGTLSLTDNESAGSGWFTLGEAIKQDLLPLNKKIIQDNIASLKRYAR